MSGRRYVVLPENEALAAYMTKKRQEMAQEGKGWNEGRDTAIHTAVYNVRASKTPILTLKDLSGIKGVGKWTVKLMKGFFGDKSGLLPGNDRLEKGKKVRRYVPQKNSVAYALLITLHRESQKGVDHMLKQELIDAAEASGLSRVPIARENSKGRDFGTSSKDWYTGWSCMKTLIDKGLVVKSSCPAKYRLTPPGVEVAVECLRKSNMLDPCQDSAPTAELRESGRQGVEDSEVVFAKSPEEVRSLAVDSPEKSSMKKIPPECLNKVMQMGYSKEETLCAFREVFKTSEKDVSLLWPSVVCHLKQNQVYAAAANVEREEIRIRDSREGSTNYNGVGGDANGFSSNSYRVGTSAFGSCTIGDSRPKTKMSYGASQGVLSMPPLNLGEKFEDVYEVILILDNREHFANQGPNARNIIGKTSKEFKIKIEVKRLPVGDGIWIARHKLREAEYVLDFIVERKKVTDLLSSIRDNRYKDQKLRLVRSGLKKLIYLIEGDPNCSEAADTIKTACFTTEVLEGFDVQRTMGLGETMCKYGHLTHAIAQYYESDLPNSQGICPSYNEFIKKCEELDKLTVSDVFAVQLMQVPHVTEDVAVAVLELYPTLISLASAYQQLDGDIRAQEEMLNKEIGNTINLVASKNIFQLVWGN